MVNLSSTDEDPYHPDQFFYKDNYSPTEDEEYYQEKYRPKIPLSNKQLPKASSRTQLEPVYYKSYKTR